MTTPAPSPEFNTAVDRYAHQRDTLAKKREQLEETRTRLEELTREVDGCQRAYDAAVAAVRRLALEERETLVPELAGTEGDETQ